MKEKISALFLLIFFLLFTCYQVLMHNKPLVLNVLTPTLLQVDLNRNNIIDEDENVCVAGINSFTANLKYISEDLETKLNLTYEKSIALGYLSDSYASNILIGNPVKLKFTDKKTPSCRYAEVYLNDKNYADMLYDNGFGIKDDLTYNKDAFKTLLARAEKLKLVILNHKSLKYHTLNCKYGKVAHDAVVVPENEVPKDAKPCKYCHLSKYENKFINKSKEITPPPNIITDGNLKLILTDFTRILRPDRNCSHQVCRELVGLIDSANETVDIALYGWADIKKVNDAIERAKSRGVKFRVVYDFSGGKSDYYPETRNFISRFSDVRSDEIKDNKKLTSMLMHNKFAIFDNKKVYTGSMNFSTTGLSGFNHNAVLVINSPSIAALYKREFDKMYDGKFHTLKEQSSDNEHIMSADSEVSVYFSPQDKGISNALVPVVKGAKRYIYIPTFILTHELLYDAILEAKARGVEIRVIIDATGTSATHSKISELRKNGIKVKTENYAGKMHAKSMIVDDEYLIIGSANFSSSAENKNDENMLIIKNSKLAKLYKDYFEYFWLKIPEKYLKYNVSAESKYSIGSCSDGVDNDFDGKIDKLDSGCQK